MKINIPEKFLEKLSGKYKGFVESSYEKYSDIITDNKLIFFSEFTDHGINHIEEVLETAANLISKESYEHLNEKDIAVLTIAVILHDVGMHISAEGLKKLLSGDFEQFRISGFDSKSWREEWDDFYHEAKRFNEDQLNNIFGNSKQLIEEPCLDKLDPYTLKIYGEFLRRNHHRLAHEIALGGFPTALTQDNIQLELNNIENELLDLCGLVARSHGMAMRDTFNYLNETFDLGWKTPFGTKVFFLMAILRIADYIQIHPERASPILVKTKRFSSPISEQEWQKHNAVKDININTDDPERIFVTANPENSVIYLELKKLFHDIQSEFDLSWAVLGEIYGRNEKFSNLKMNYRRLTSNIDNKQKFSKSISYIPEKIRFNADPELLKLLIGPLYGEDSKYGIRELLQNSLDAVKERGHLTDDFDKNIYFKISSIDDQKKYKIEIRDKGIGMTQDTIINYFFKAGASFRNSMVWKKSFVENDSVQIEKTGRFGVGVLAVFLLGDEFVLTTRSCHEDEGYTCTVSLNTKQVELTKTQCEIGTVISIRLSEKNNELINSKLKLLENNQSNQIRVGFAPIDWFDWYRMDEPKMIYDFTNQNLEKIFAYTRKKDFVSAKADQPSKSWHKFSTPDFPSIHWTIDIGNDYVYDNYGRRSRNNDFKPLICNGISIIRGYKLTGYPWANPIVSVFDGNARMPLSLSRDYLLNDRLPFEKELITAICNKVIDQVLETEFRKIGDFWEPLENILDIKIPIDISKYIVIYKDEYTLMMPELFESINVEVFYQFWLNCDNPQSIFVDDDVFYQAKTVKKDTNIMYKSLLESNFFDGSTLNDWFSIGNINIRKYEHTNYFIRNDKFLYMLEKNRLSTNFYGRRKSNNQLFSEKWTVLQGGQYFQNDKIDFLFEENETNIQAKNLKRKKTIGSKLGKLDKKKLDSRSIFFIRENFTVKDNNDVFDLFKKVWEERFKGRYLIPIEKKYR